VLAPLFVPDDIAAATSDAAWVQAMLDAERALAAACARAGAIPADAAAAIARACEAARFDARELAIEGRRSGNPVEPLVRALTDATGGEAGRWVHWGATSQDIVDTAAMLVARRAIALILERLDAVAAASAALADAHRATQMAARTLLQQAVPTTFGLKAAGWLVGVLDARRALVRVLDERLAAQLGGAAGTLAAYGSRAGKVARAYAEELGLHMPVLPWHTHRARIAELGAALDLTAASAAKIALDVALLAQTEVGEVAESAAGGSSTMPQKRNPVASTLALACARTAHGHGSVLAAGAPHEHERAIGGWHAEWPALTGTLAFTGGAVAAAQTVVERLEVDETRMRQNLELTDGLVAAERVSYLLAERLGRREAHDRVGAAAARSRESGRPIRDELAADPAVEIPAADLDAALDVRTYVGAADALVERALDAYRREVAAK
jgi:3-carboxy-cis,cis-muconate cycloisomerase